MKKSANHPLPMTNIIRHLIEHGSIDREALDKCLKTKIRNRIDEILVVYGGISYIVGYAVLPLFRKAQNVGADAVKTQNSK